jgi:hypothetical protein
VHCVGNACIIECLTVHTILEKTFVGLWL